MFVLFRPPIVCVCVCVCVTANPRSLVFVLSLFDDSVALQSVTPPILSYVTAQAL